jgi:hypothetical protein
MRGYLGIPGAWLVAANTVFAAEVRDCEPALLPEHYANRVVSVSVWAGSTPAPSCVRALEPMAVLVEATGRLSGIADSRQVLERFAAVRSYAGLPYWSTLRGRWQPMITSSTGLDDAGAVRPDDFSVDELARGETLLFRQVDNTLGAITYRIRVDVLTPSTLSVSVVNATAARRLFITVFAPGELVYRHQFRALGAGQWAYEGEIRVAGESSFLTRGHGASYANRADAIFRHIAGLRPEDAPPVAP